MANTDGGGGREGVKRGNANLRVKGKAKNKLKRNLKLFIVTSIVKFRHILIDLVALINRKKDHVTALSV